MKLKTQDLLEPLSKKEIATLCTEVNETGLTQKQIKRFTLVDLWNIQRNRRTAVSRIKFY